MPSYLFTWIFVSLFLTCQAAIPITDAPALNCKTVQSIPNYTLKGHVISSLNGKNFETCVTQCERDEKCFSINYNHAIRLCQINAKSRGTNPCDFTFGDEWDVYMDSLEHFQKNACAIKPCKNNGTCQVTSSCPGYVCHCGSFSSGPQCEGNVELS